MRFSKLMAAVLFTPAALALVTLPGCGTSPATPAETKNMQDQSMARLKVMEESNPSLVDIVNNSYGYAILPEVTKAGLGITAGGGKGVVYRKGGQIWGNCQVQMAGVGVSVGGETYSELLVFNSAEAFQKFLDSGVKFDPAASATIVKAGATVTPTWNNGIAVFISDTHGFMIDASLGGQQFTTTPAQATPVAPTPTTGPAAM